MGMNVNNQRITSRRRSRHRPMGEINVTPMVDVMLVLLIVFMVTAPLLTIGVEVDLTKMNTSRPVQPTEHDMFVTVKKDGTLYIQDTEIEPDQLLPRLSAMVEANEKLRILVKGDRLAEHGEVLRTWDKIREALPSVYIITRPDEDSERDIVSPEEDDD